MFPTSTDGSHISKYLTTLGVAVVGASLAGGALFFRSDSDLLIPVDELRRLTPTAQQAIENRQALILTASEFGWVFVLGGMALGLVLIFFGLRGWRQHQKDVDVRGAAELAEILGRISQLSVSEQSKRIDDELREMREGLTSEGEEWSKGKRVDQTSVAEPTLAEPTEETEEELLTPKLEELTPSTGAREDPRDLVLEVERQLAAKLQKLFGREVITNASVASPLGESTAVDAIVLAADGFPVYVIEIKVVPAANSISRRIASSMTQLSFALRDLGSPSRAGSVVAVLILVTADDDASKVGKYYAIFQDLRIKLRMNARLIVTTRSEFESMSPDALLQLMR